MSALLEISGLSVAYGKAPAVDGVTLKVPPGAIVTVIGPNGAGKTTLLNAVMGLLPSQGSVRFAGQDVQGERVEARVEAGLGLVPEKRELFGPMSVEDNLLLGSYSRRATRDGSREADLAAAFARFPRLKERRAQLASTLSGGERQMLAIARALMARPRLLMLDEPSLGLAPLVVREVFEIVTSLRDIGVSILIVEQNARAALQIADYGYVLETGAITLEGDAHKLTADPRVAASYLGLHHG
jgi:branched-chain amino acid transport system ATP-binding protein